MARKIRKKKREKRSKTGSKGLRISLCMIARDEERFLGDCLKSVQGLVDEIVLADTGSQDQSLSVAKGFGARTLSFPWDEDFSAARNASIEAATGDWIFQMDCDEVIAPRDLGSIRRSVVTGGCDGYLMTTRNYARESNRARWVACRGEYPEERGYPGWFPTTKVRLFRRDPMIRYRGAVHELVDQAILDVGGKIGECMVPVHHYGYMEKERGPGFYLGVAEKKVQQEPENPKAFFELASVYFDLRRFDDAIQAIERTIDLIEKGGVEQFRGVHLEWELVYNAYGSMLDGARRFDEAILSHQKALSSNPKSYQALNNIGSLFERKGDPAQAVSYYEKALTLSPDTTLIRENLDRTQKHVNRRSEDSEGQGIEAKRRPGGEKLSVAMIVKDGEQTLGACLESVKGIADEIVVVDTGSSDRTVEVAREHGARIEHFAWRDDFSAARNASIQMAAGDWVLWMDADDVLPKEEHQKIRKAMARGPGEAFYFSLENTGADRSRYPQLRLFPNLPGVRFERPVHEQVVGSLEGLGIRCVRTDIRVVHTGYTTDAITSKKRRKYLGMMRRWLAAHPEDADVRFRVGHTLYGEGDSQAAELEFKLLADDETLKMQRPSIARMALTFLGRVRMDLKRHDQALEPLTESVDMAPGSALARLYLGECLLEMGRAKEAREHLTHALENEEGEVFFPVDPKGVRRSCEELLERCGEAGVPGSRDADHQKALDLNGRGAKQNASKNGRESGDRLSLAMIVKDEADRLGRCLESVQGLVDEIVVVDTGSSDGTVEVARGYGAKVHYFEWCEDFSAARNESLKHASGDWIMWLDADDIFPKENHPKVRRAMKEGKGKAFYFRLQDEGFDATSCLQLRLFPNLQGVQFEMPVHEQVSLSLGRLGIRMGATDIVVRHTGYTTQEVVKAKQARYFKIMTRWLETHPEDYIVRNHKAHTHYVWGELDDAIREYQRIVDEGAAEADRNLIIQTTAHLYIGRSQMRKGAHEEALGPLHEALKLDDHYAVTHMTLGECYVRLNRIDESIRHLELAKRYEDQVTFAPNDPSKIRGMIRLFLGKAYEAQENFGEAVRWFEAAVSEDAQDVEVLGPLSTALRKLGRTEEAKGALEKAAARDPQNPNHPYNLGVMALEGGDLGVAEGFFK